MIGPAASVASAAGLGCLAVGLGCLVAVLGWFAAGWGDWLLGWGGWLQSGSPPVGLEGFCSPPSVLALSTKTSPQCAKVTLLVGISIKNKRKISFSKVFATWGDRE